MKARTFSSERLYKKRTEELTGRLLHLHHQSLQRVQSLQLLLFVLQVLLQQLGPRLNLLTVHLVGVFTCGFRVMCEYYTCMSIIQEGFTFSYYIKWILKLCVAKL